MVKINGALLDELIRYIERTEVNNDGEWGSCRELHELIDDGDMPKLYYKLLELRWKDHE